MLGATASQSPDDDRVEQWVWTKKEPPLDHSAGDLDQMVVGREVAQLSTHTRRDVEEVVCPCSNRVAP